MDNDDQQLGHILSRREVLALIGAGSAALLAACATAAPSGNATTSAATQRATAVAANGATQESTTVATRAGSTAAPAGSAPTTTSTGNAEAATAVAIGDNPTAATAVAAEAVTAEVGNTAIAANGTTLPACVVRPEVTEGPYYVSEDLVRSDIRTDSTTGTVQEGAPLTLTFNVSQISNASCTALQGATVEIWHCNSVGQYSDVTDPGFTTKGQNWLRGAQVTDANGTATFTTIYPGWYSGRAVHIHFKVHPDETKVFTSQLFFDDALSQQVFTQASYTNKSSTPDTLNSTDTIYQDLLLLTTTTTDQGYGATFALGIDPSTVGSGESGGNGGPGGGPPPNGTGGPGGPPPNGTPGRGGPPRTGTQQPTATP